MNHYKTPVYNQKIAQLPITKCSF